MFEVGDKLVKSPDSKADSLYTGTVYTVIKVNRGYYGCRVRVNNGSWDINNWFNEKNFIKAEKTVEPKTDSNTEFKNLSEREQRLVRLIFAELSKAAEEHSLCDEYEIFVGDIEGLLNMKIDHLNFEPGEVWKIDETTYFVYKDSYDEIWFQSSDGKDMCFNDFGRSDLNVATRLYPL